MYKTNTPFFFKRLNCFLKSYCTDSTLRQFVRLIVGGAKKRQKSKSGHRDAQIKTEKLQRKAQGRNWFPRLVSTGSGTPNWSCRRRINFSQRWGTSTKRLGKQQIRRRELSHSELKAPPCVGRRELVHVTRLIVSAVPQVERQLEP